ncbi:protein of unknown function [Cognatiyoonia sediminum]|uniref:DNA mimic protein DMP19 C-terminal domain-containing protein n=1 Tax=Cognatiyoonia sediminum TaxID=1508389 RepID=A0A1M5Q574_9RHOB|nr:DUF4375 domain-containing protein [Cognatiyoonia sediminum]SHH09284.1 protein of unknown function [Cognatiyoonia sediminum]
MLKALLNKAKTAFESKSESPKPIAAQPKYQQHLDLIVVPESAMDAFPDDPNPLVDAMVNYVNFLTQQAQFNRFEISAEAIQAYHVDYYLAQVKNGGHAQFVGNSGANLAYTLADVIDGLKAMKAFDHLALAEKMSKWVAENPEDADAQTGAEGGIAPELAALDNPFYELEKAHPLRPIMAEWIANLEVLQAVDDRMMPRVLQGIKTLNPNLRTRQSKTHIAKLVNQLSNPLFLGLGMAGAKAAKIEPLLQVGTGSNRNVDGQNTMTWFVQTTEGKRFGLSTETGVELREYVDPNGETLPVSLKDTSLDHITSFVPVEVGNVVNSVTHAEIDATKAVCAKLNAPIAIEMLLAKLPEDTEADYVSVRSTGQSLEDQLGASIYVVCNQGSVAYSAIVEESGARLLTEPSHDLLVQVSAVEISEFIEGLQAA